MNSMPVDKDASCRIAMSFWSIGCLRNGLEAGDIFCRDSVRFSQF